MGRSTSSSQRTEGSTSIIKNVSPPLQTRFCRYANEFHEDRGLSLDGVDPRSIHGNNDINDKQWSEVFACPKPALGTTKKVKAYHVRPEFAAALVHRHWDVYQEGPFMYEIGQQFAKAFALENCVAAITGTTAIDCTIAWAHFAERAMKNSEERHHLQNKRKKWDEQMKTKVNQSVEQDQSFKGKEEFKYTSRSVRFSATDLIRMCKMKEETQERLSVAKSTLQTATDAVEDSIKKLHIAEGKKQSTCASNLQSEIMELSSESDRQRLLVFMEKMRANVEVDILELEHKVQISKV